MEFNPEYNYGETDLKIEENLVLWKFGELIKMLITLASNADKQRDITGGFGSPAEEMAEDFDTLTLSFQQLCDYKLLSEDSFKSLKQLDQFFDEHSFDITPQFWYDENLDTNADWKRVRQLSTEILMLLNMDHFDIEFDREEKYGMSEDGKKQLIMQQTKTRLIRKTSSL